jgi:hypothetical protein
MATPSPDTLRGELKAEGTLLGRTELLRRMLPPEEWPRLLSFTPFSEGGLPSPDATRIIVAEVGGPGGEIRAFWTITGCVHVEPMWIHPEERKRPGLIRGLWREVVETLREHGVVSAFACILDRDAAMNMPYVARLGFQKLPGDLYMLLVPNADGTVPTLPGTAAGPTPE